MASLVYRGSSRTARATQRNPVSKIKRNLASCRPLILALRSQRQVVICVQGSSRTARFVKQRNLVSKKTLREKKGVGERKKTTKKRGEGV